MDIAGKGYQKLDEEVERYFADLAINTRDNHATKSCYSSQNLSLNRFLTY